MAGHSKWANIRHKKGRADARKGKVFSRAAKEIISAIKEGGSPDPKSNAKLRLAMDKAKAANVPNDVIERNIKKASSADQAAYDEITYELYGHGGVGILVEVMTDNKNRSASDIRIATNKRGGSIANPGAVAYNFERKGVIKVPEGDAIEDELFLAVSEAGAEDFEKVDDTFMITTPASDLFKVKEAVDHMGIAHAEAGLEMIPTNSAEVNEEDAKKNLALIEWLEDLDDVDTVYHNMSPPDDFNPDE